MTDTKASAAELACLLQRPVHDVQNAIRRTGVQPNDYAGRVRLYGAQAVWTIIGEIERLHPVDVAGIRDGFEGLVEDTCALYRRLLASVERCNIPVRQARLKQLQQEQQDLERRIKAEELAINTLEVSQRGVDLITARLEEFGMLAEALGVDFESPLEDVPEVLDECRVETEAEGGDGE